MEKLLVATVLKPQGLKGQVKVKPYNLDVSLFKKGLVVYKKNNETLTLETVSFRGGFLYLTFKGYNVIEQVEHLRNEDLYVEEVELNELNEGEYYIKDLIGCEVLTTEGKLLGTITEIDNYGAADIYTVVRDNNEILFAFIEGLFTKVNVEEKIVEVDEELLKEVVV